MEDQGLIKNKCAIKTSLPGPSVYLNQCENLWAMTLTSNKVCKSLEKWIQIKVCKIYTVRLQNLEPEGHTTVAASGMKKRLEEEQRGP